MKKQLLLSGFAVIAAVLFLPSCSREVPVDGDEMVASPEFAFTTNIRQLERKAGDKFEVGDVVDLKLTAPDGKIQINDSFTNGGSKWTASQGTHYWYAGSGEGAILASSGLPSGSLERSVAVCPEALSDPLRASLSGVKPKSEAVQLEFRHILSQVQLIVTTGDQDETVQSVTASGFARAANYDLSAGSFSSLEGTGSMGCASLGNGMYSFNFIPQTCSITFVVTTNKRVVTFSSEKGSPKTYEGGCSYRASLVLPTAGSPSEFLLITSVVDWLDGGELPTEISKVEKREGVTYVESISLDPTVFALSVGESRTVSATVLPASAADRSLTWMSLKPSVATVSDGVVSGVAEGSALIYAYANDGSGISALCAVSVSGGEAGNVKVTGVSLDATTLQMTVGASQTLTATVVPDNATDMSVTWKSSAPSVATVSSGVVSAFSAGNAEITVTTTDGGFVARCQVTVISSTPVPSGDPIPVTLTESMISTNAPMKYVTYDFTPQGEWGAASGWNNRAIGEIAGAYEARKSKWDTKSNLWDDNAATSFSTNFDIFETGYNWGTRDLVSYNYIQITLGAPVTKFKLYFKNSDSGAYLGYFDILTSSDGTTFTKLSQTPFQVPSAAFGAEFTGDELTAGSPVSYIRIQPDKGYTNPEGVGDFKANAGYFGLAELKLWCLDDSYTPVQVTPATGEVRTIDSPSTTAFLPRCWKSGLDDSSTAWYKYWSDPTGVWNNEHDYLWLPNCTHYCMGRSAEISKRPIYSNHELFSSGYPNAQNWYANAKWAKGSTPKLGAILVWNGGQYGHVAIVEKINDDGTVNISQSSYQETNRTSSNPKYFEYVENLSCVVGYVTAKIGWTFSGYVYNPYVNDIRKSRNTSCSQVEVFVDKLVVRDDNMTQTGLSVLPGIYNVYDVKKNGLMGYDWVKIADNAWIPLNTQWNTMYY